MREIRISPDGNAVAIRTDAEESAWNAYGVIHAIDGGHWEVLKEVSDWKIVKVTKDA